MTETTDTRQPGQTLKASELRIGDIVTLSIDNALAPFNQIIVRNIRLDDRYDPKFRPTAYLSRPYALLGDWVTTAGVGVSLATEEFTVDLEHSATFVLVKPTDAERHARAIQKERDEQQATVKGLQDTVLRLRGTITSREAELVEARAEAARASSEAEDLDAARKDTERRLTALRTEINFFAQKVAQ